VAAALHGWLDRRRGVAWRWSVPGLLVIGLACLGFLALRELPARGLTIVLWLILVVVATDVGAYAAGRRFGGPKLWPRVSPNKTWAGLGGGVLCAACTGAAVAVLTGGGMAGAAALLSAGLAVVAQGGDLVESAVKRRFGVKDAGRLIPGHGGLLDRLDGLTAATLAVVAAALLGARPGFLS
jgi:phosphatidate cytidylyltransferase